MSACRATDDDWIADFNCMYTNDLRTNFSAPISSKKIQLHKGFWNAYSVLDKSLIEEVNKAVSAVKVNAALSATVAALAVL